MFRPDLPDRTLPPAGAPWSSNREAGGRIQRPEELHRHLAAMLVAVFVVMFALLAATRPRRVRSARPRRRRALTPSLHREKEYA